MANRYSKIFTLTDIFTDKNLRDKLPLVSYKEGTTDKGRVSQRTQAKSVGYLVYDKAKLTATPYYTPLKASKNGDYIVIDGITEYDLSTITDKIYNALLGIKQMLIFTANDMEIVRYAIKESERAKRSGRESKLALRLGSKLELQGMSDKQRNMLMNDIMKNIYFSDDFTETRKKFGLDKLKRYEQNRVKWLHDIGV